MELINSTRMIAGYTMGLERSGREVLVIVVKGTFRIPAEPGARLQLHEEQLPLATSDTYWGEPGLSALKYEADFPPRKLKCDVLLHGTAYAPQGRPVERVAVGLKVGEWSKSFNVVGDRLWIAAGGLRATSPQPFLQQPISYDFAFGGVDQHHEDPAEHGAFMPNPSGRGYHRHLRSEWLDGSPLPNTEEPGHAVTHPDGSYRPMSFGPIGRHWEPRYRYAGTYDQAWREKVFPFLPADFDERYYQSAPEDQQIPLPVGEQTVSLVNVTPDGIREFTLPHFDAPITIFPRRGAREDGRASVDTIMIEPDLERVTMAWRLARPLKRNMLEVAQVLVGRKGPEWWQQRERPGFPIPIVTEPMAAQSARPGSAP
jgi:hypothetical protein